MDCLHEYLELRAPAKADAMQKRKLELRKSIKDMCMKHNIRTASVSKDKFCYLDSGYKYANITAEVLSACLAEVLRMKRRNDTTLRDMFLDQLRQHITNPILELQFINADSVKQDETYKLKESEKRSLREWYGELKLIYETLDAAKLPSPPSGPDAEKTKSRESRKLEAELRLLAHIKATSTKSLRVGNDTYRCHIYDSKPVKKVPLTLIKQWCPEKEANDSTFLKYLTGRFEEYCRNSVRERLKLVRNKSSTSPGPRSGT